MRQITISGNVGKEPTINNTQNGMQVANFSVAVRRNRPDNNGEYGTDWFRCSVWGKRATTIEKFYHKGSHVTVTGDFEASEYNGSTQLGVNVSDFDLPDNSNQNNHQPSNDNQTNQAPFTNQGEQIDVSDSDLPF